MQSCKKLKKNYPNFLLKMLFRYDNLTIRYNVFIYLNN